MSAASDDNRTPRTLLQRVIHDADQQAWAEFVRFFAPLVRLWGRRRGLHDQDAEELVNEVFVLLRRKLPDFQYDPSRTFRGWLITVTHNRWIELHRKKRPGLLAGDDQILRELPASDGPDPLGDEQEWRRMVIARAMDLLADEFESRDRTAFIEHVCHGRTAAHVAAELGISAGAVWQIALRMRRKLNERLKPFLED